MSHQLLERYLERCRRSELGGVSAMIRADDTSVFPRFLDLTYPSIERGEGVWLSTTDGRRILDACSGGAMVSCLGHGVPEIVAAAADQAERISYFYNHHFTSEPQERLADRLLQVAAPEMARVRFVSGGSEANETALQLARLYHVERGQSERWRVISPAQSYHGSTMGTLALTGRRAIQEPYTPYLASHLHLAPSTWRFDPSGAMALQELDRLLDEAGPETVAAFFCEPVSAAALPGYSPPERFWLGLEERRREHGFLICFDEVVTGMGRVGSWLAAHQLPIEPDIVAIGKGLGAGYAPARRRPLHAARVRRHRSRLAGVRPRSHVGRRAALLRPSASPSSTSWSSVAWSSACAERGPSLRDELEAALQGSEIVREVRGRGFLLGVELVDPRDGESFLPVELDVAALVDDTAFEHGRARHLHAPAGRRLRRRPDAPRPCVRQHGRGARGDDRSVRDDDRARGAPDQGSLVGLAERPGESMSPEGSSSEEFVLLGIPDVERFHPRQGASAGGIRVSACATGR